MSSKVERERRKAQLLSQIQQQRLDLSASRREWLEATGAYDRRWNMLLSLRSWALVGSSVMAIWTIRHPNMLSAGPDAVLAYGAPGVWLKRPSSSNSFAVNFPLAGAIPALSLKFFEDF